MIFSDPSSKQARNTGLHGARCFIPALAALVLGSCAPQPTHYSWHGRTMGTLYHITVVGKGLSGEKFLHLMMIEANLLLAAGRKFGIQHGSSHPQTQHSFRMYLHRAVATLHARRNTCQHLLAG